MRHIDPFGLYLINEHKPYSDENFRLFTQIIGLWLQQEFSSSGADKNTFVEKLPFYDVNYEVKTDPKKTYKAISLSDVEEQEKDNFKAYLLRIGKSNLINQDFESAIGYFGKFIFQLSRKTANHVINKLKDNFPGLEDLMKELIKRKTKPVQKQEEVSALLQSVEAPRVLKKRGRAPGTKNKPKVPQEVVKGGIPIDLVMQFKREGVEKIRQLELDIIDLDKKIDELIKPYISEIRAKSKEIDMRKKALGIEDEQKS